MKICLPVEEDRGLESPVCPHFGRAPLHLILDTESGRVEPLPEPPEGTEHCRPLQRIVDARVDEVWCCSLGHGAATNLHIANIAVRKLDGGNIAEALQRYQAEGLPVVVAEDLCAGHDHDDEAHHCHCTGQ